MSAILSPSLTLFAYVEVPTNAVAWSAGVGIPLDSYSVLRQNAPFLGVVANRFVAPFRGIFLCGCTANTFVAASNWIALRVVNSAVGGGFPVAADTRFAPTAGTIQNWYTATGNVLLNAGDQIGFFFTRSPAPDSGAFQGNSRAWISLVQRV